MQKFYFTIIIILFFLPKVSFSQEFRQIYNCQQKYNSAFAGFNKCSGIYLLNKIHPVIKNINYISNAVLVENFFDKFSGATLFSYEYNKLPQSIFKKQKIKFAFTYHLKLNKKNMLSLSLGTQYYTENFDNSLLIFPSMQNLWENNILPNTEIIPDYRYRQISFLSGLVYWNKSFYAAFGVSDFFNLYKNETFGIYPKFSVLFQKRFFKQSYDSYNSLNTGIFADRYSIKILAGYYYFKNILEFGITSQNIYQNRNLSLGIILNAGIKIHRIKISYGIDFYYSGIKFQKSFSNEISIHYLIKCYEKNTNNTINCPSY